MKRRLGLLAIVLSMASLVLHSPEASAQEIGPCADPSRVLQQHVVSGIPTDDPDGGLVMRAGPGTQSPRVGVLAPDETQVWPTGQCWRSSSGSIWYQIWNRSTHGTAWVSSNFLRPFVPEVHALPPIAAPGWLYVPPGSPSPLPNMPPAPVPGFVAAPATVPPYVPAPPPMLLPPWPTYRGHGPRLVVCG